MGAKSRRKGANGEREVAEVARLNGFPAAKRAAPMQAAGYASEFGDVIGIDPLHIECKCYQRTPVGRFAREHLDVERPGFVPCLVWRDARTPWRATLAWADLLKLLRELHDLRTQVALLDPPFTAGGSR